MRIQLHPISGNAGAAAAEDAAALVNALHRKLQARTHRLSTEDYKQMFAETQCTQEKRTKTLLHHATKMQEFDAMQSLFAPLLVKFVLPNLTDDAAMNIIGENVLGRQRVEALPMPRRPRYVPCVDELPVRPLNDLRVGKVIGAIPQLGLAVSLIMGNFLKPFKDAPYHLDSYLKHYTHAATASGEASCSTQSCRVALIPVVLIWNIEGFRRGIIESLGSWCVLIFALHSHSPADRTYTRPITMILISALVVARPSITLPLDFLLSICNSERNAYASPAGRPIPPSTVAAATACTIAVYAPLVIMNVTPQNLYPRSPLWRWTPVVISIIIRALAARLAINKYKHASHTKPGKGYLEVYLNKDYSPLMTMYAIVLVMALLAHFFNPMPPSFVQALILPVGAWCLSSVYQRRRLDYTTTREAIMAMVCILALGKTVGAGAVYTGTWIWRERVLYRLNN